MSGGVVLWVPMDLSIFLELALSNWTESSLPWTQIHWRETSKMLVLGLLWELLDLFFSSSCKKSSRNVEMTDSEIRVLAKADPTLQESLVSENTPDMFDGEQYLSPEDEEQAQNHLMLSEDQLKEKKVFKVPKGTSEYQAAWIVDQLEEKGDDRYDDEVDEDSDQEMEIAPAEEDSDAAEEEEEDYDTITVTSEMTDADNDYDEKHVNFEEEQQTLRKLKEERLDAMFPDEVDTPADVPARIRFQKYRGLKSFR